MATARATFDFPASYINEYLYEQLSKYEDINMAQGSAPGLIPFFPAGQAVNITDIYNELSLSASNSLPAVIYYDRMIRLRNTSFPIGKREQVLYTVYGDVANCTNIGNVIFQILDREDYSAQDLNKWITSNKSWLSIPMFKDDGTRNSIVFNGKTKYGAGLPMKIFFRNLRVFQADESQDLVDLDDYRRGSIHKYIVEYDYHLKDNPEFLEG
jgi:hypothetical protein